MDLYQHHLATWSRPKLEAAIRRRVQTVYLGENVVLARILGRHKIFLRTTDKGFGCHVMMDGYWEMWLTQFLARYLRKGMTVVDVGANFGYYTLLFGDIVGSEGRVIAVEPNPDTAPLLDQSISLNGYASRVRVIAKALGSQTGESLLYLPHGEPKNATIVDRPDHPGGRTVRILTTTLDSVAAEVDKVDLVKIDVEGAEVDVVAGMERLIERDHPTIVLEYNAARYADPLGFLDKLRSAYTYCHEITPDGTITDVDTPSIIDRGSLSDRLLLFRMKQELFPRS